MTGTGWPDIIRRVASFTTVGDKGLKLKTNIGLSAEYRAPVPFSTLRDLLRHVGSEVNYPVLSELERGEDLIQVLLNGKEIWFYPSHLDTPLREGDVVEVYLIPLEGG